MLGFTYLDGVATNFSDPAGISNGISSTTVAGINNSGEISGDYTPSGGGSEGFIYSNGIFTNFSDPGTGPDGSTYVAGINNSGLIAGSYTDSEGNSHGFTYSNGAFTNFTDPNGTYPDAFDPFLINSNTEVTGINDSGEVIGDYVDSSGAQHGFIYSKGVFTPGAAPQPRRATSSAMALRMFYSRTGALLPTGLCKMVSIRAGIF